MIECTLCLKCWKITNTWRREFKQGPNNNQVYGTDETSALLIGAAEVGAEKRLSTTKNPTNNAIVLDHHIFDSSEGWKKAESMQHPTLKLRINVDTTDYEHVGVKCPNVKPSHINTVMDTGAQSCF